MSLNEWRDPKLAQVYSEKAASPLHNWYEYEVNLPSMLTLMPPKAKFVLDFGCGAGDITALLAQKYATVEGCDPSQSMLAISREDYPALSFFEWDATKTLAQKQERYDVIFSKLALHFIEDLSTVANHLQEILKPGGALVFSVPHPMSTIRKTANTKYWQQTPYPTQIGSYGIQVTMIHRSLQDYLDPFLNNGFVLTGFVEPEIPNEIANKHETNQNDKTIPKRINVRFTKPERTQE